MGSGHASHKSGDVKHSHDSGQIDAAANITDNPEDLLEQPEGYPFNAQGSEVNSAATERPQDSPSTQKQN